VNAAYEGHCHAAREIAEAYFDATEIARLIVEEAHLPAHERPGTPTRAGRRST
jgi:hypothetical protein